MTASVYTSCSCNRTPNAADWYTNSKICYSACNAVAIYVTKKPSVVKQLLIGHNARVNCVKWIKKKNHVTEEVCDSEELVSASTDGTCKVWRCSGHEKFECAATLSGHQNAVTVLDAIYTDNNDITCISSRKKEDGGKITSSRTLIASASVDSTVKVWERKTEADEFVCIQSISFGTGFALNLSWIIVPQCNVPILACGGDDQRIHVFIEQDKKFIQIQTLLGHEDWIRGLDFAVSGSGDLLLASCGQDHYIRIWRFSSQDPTEFQAVSSISQLNIEEDIKLRENTFTFTSNGKEYCYAVSLESVLQGHENWVYSVKWQPPIVKDGRVHQPMCLLSASMDKTMIIWKPDPQSGIWHEHARVGEVGGNSLGFYGGIFAPDGKSIMSHGYQGAFELTALNQDSNTWEPQVTCGGHFDSVQDIAWQPQHGNFLLSLSTDQTTRCHGYWNASKPGESSWHEIARPQIHGYDMQCLAMINRYSFASGADEKVVRIFEAPKNFLENFAEISALDLTKDIEKKSLATGASVPALGLSNKAVFEAQVKALSGGHEIESHPNEQYPEVYFTPVEHSKPPPEVDLLQNTLWPEVQKLYGHGYEVFALAAYPDGSLLASSSKAAKAEHAGIILWDTTSWKQLCTLLSHTLTVTQLAFSHDGQQLLSVSRDRTWTIFQRRNADQPQSDPLYRRLAFTDKKTSIHGRIIWGCAWSHDDRYFVTVSRDKKAIIWTRHDDQETSNSCLGPYAACSCPILLPDAVTAVDFAPVAVKNGSYLLSFGLENGCILLYTWNPEKTSSSEAWEHCCTLSQSEAHHLTVKRVKFRPKPGAVGQDGDDKNSAILQLASCGADHLVRIYNVDIMNLHSNS